MESVEHVQPDVWHWSAIQTAKMRQSPVSRHIMLDFFLHAVLRQSLLQECKEEMDRRAVQGTGEISWSQAVRTRSKSWRDSVGSVEVA